MSESKIEWTERTWNPIVGCSVLTPGCTNCYAMKMAARLEVMGNVKHYAGTTKKIKGNAVWTGKLALAPDNILLEPLKRKKPTTYFVNSMGDLFHEDCPDEWIDKVFAVMALTPQHTYQVLTKRAVRMRDYCVALHQGKRNVISAAKDIRGSIIGAVMARASLIEDNPVHIRPLPNVWLGVSTERQQEADERIPHLLQTPAAVRFISAEPLLGPIDLMMLKSGDKVYDALQGCIGTHVGDGEYDGAQPCNKLDWVIVGGESGPASRIMAPAWARSLRDQCDASGVDYFFKQWGLFAPVDTTLAEFQKPKPGHLGESVVTPAGHLVSFPVGTNFQVMRRVGKKSAGRLLDGIEHNAMPKVTA